MLPKIYKFKKIVEINGSLVPIYLDKFSNFRINRLFILLGEKNYIRGNHAHKKCSQIFIPIRGKIELEIINKKKIKVVLSPKKKKMLLVPPINWCKIKFLENKSSLLVLCNKKFSENEYIRSYAKFLKYL